MIVSRCGAESVIFELCQVESESKLFFNNFVNLEIHKIVFFLLNMLVNINSICNCNNNKYSLEIE